MGSASASPGDVPRDNGGVTTTRLEPSVAIKRAGSRTYERLDWLEAWHSFTGPAYELGTDSHFGCW